MIYKERERGDYITVIRKRNEIESQITDRRYSMLFCMHSKRKGEILCHVMLYCIIYVIDYIYVVVVVVVDAGVDMTIKMGMVILIIVKRTY